MGGICLLPFDIALYYSITMVALGRVVLTRREHATALRVCPDTLGRITKFSKHEPN
jgi:hypothetical protein